MAEPQQPLKTTGLALDGKAVKVDDFSEKPTSLPRAGTVTKLSVWEDYTPGSDIDYTDLQAVNSELSQLRLRLHEVRIALKNVERDVVAYKYAYEAQKKRYMVRLSGGSATEREAMAELLCEDLYTSFLVTQTVAKEISQHSRDMRNDLDALKEISNNLRRQIDLT